MVAVGEERSLEEAGELRSGGGEATFFSELHARI